MLKTYMLIFDDPDFPHPLKMELDLADPASLFSVVERRVTGRIAELWLGDNYIAHLSRSDTGVWKLASSPDRSRPN
jgi:hypothetical protein